MVFADDESYALNKVMIDIYAATGTFADPKKLAVDAAATVVVCREVSVLLLLIDDDRPCISLAATATASTMPPTLCSKPAASSRLAASC